MMDTAVKTIARAFVDKLDRRHLPMRVGTRGSPLALVQARAFITSLTGVLPTATAAIFEEQVITTTGDTVQDRKLSEIGGKGLFAKEIHEALVEGRIDCAVHSLKDLETSLPPHIILACTMPREDPRDVLIIGPRGVSPDPKDPLSALPHGAVVGTSSVRRQSQLLHTRPDLRMVMLRGNVQTRMTKLRDGQCDATILALAGLKRLGMEVPGPALPGAVILEPETMLPAAAQGIVGITVRADDAGLRALFAAIDDEGARAAATAERALLAELDGSCRTPIGAYARILADGRMLLTAMVAREDGTFLLSRNLLGRPADAERLGRTLGTSLRADSPSEIFAD
jgi:hydroxymethylbilane synthase